MTNEEKIAALERQLLESRAREAAAVMALRAQAEAARRELSLDHNHEVGLIPSRTKALLLGITKQPEILMRPAAEWLQGKEKRAAAEELGKLVKFRVGGDYRPAVPWPAIEDCAVLLRAEADALDAGEVAGG